MDSSVEEGLSPLENKAQSSPRPSCPPWARTLHPLAGENLGMPRHLNPKLMWDLGEMWAHVCPGRVWRNRAEHPCSSRHCALQGHLWLTRRGSASAAHGLGFSLAQPHLWPRSQAEPGLPACCTLSSPQALLSSQVKRLCAAQCLLHSWSCCFFSQCLCSKGLSRSHCVSIFNS